MKQKGTLLDIAIKTKKGLPIHLMNSAEVSIDTGVSNDLRGKPGKRQVTVLSMEAWKTVCTKLSTNLHWSNRRANLLISGIQLENSTNKLLSIGNVILKITGETTPCKLMDEKFKGLKKVLEPNWNGGVTCTVIQGGIIQKGDSVSL